jgi:hypothetical protein
MDVEEKERIIPITSVVQPRVRQERARWVSCCLETDRQAVVYFGQLSFSFSVLIFCCAMLVLADGDCDKSSAYISLISFLLGKLLSTVVDSKN